MTITDELFKAVHDEDLEQVASLLKQIEDIEGRDTLQYKSGYTPLIAAAATGNLDCLELLLNAGANVNAHTDYGLSVLAMAATNAGKVGNNKVDQAYECVELLYNRGAQFELTEKTIKCCDLATLKCIAYQARVLGAPNADELSDTLCRHQIDTGLVELVVAGDTGAAEDTGDVG